MKIATNKNKVIGALLGTIVEYYDYTLYAFSAGVLAAKFFPELDKLTSLTYIFAIYATSYMSKPLGSLIFSRIGDLYGRKFALQITVIGIAFPTLTIGLLPEYSLIGSTGAYILALCRFMQGFFTAGEYDGAAIYVIEHLGSKRHFTASALTRATGVAGLLLSIAVTNFFNSSLFPDWCWRIPFLLSMPFAALTVYYRKFLEETPDFIDSKQEKSEFVGLIKFITKRWKTLFLVIMLAGGFGVTYQISVIFMKEYLPLVVPKTRDIMASFSVIMVLAFGSMMPFSGLMADKFGAHLVVKYSLAATLVTIIILAIAIKFQIFNLVIISTLLLTMSVAPFNALAHGFITKIFTARERYRGVGIGHTIGSMLMSGTANYICIMSMKEFNVQLFPLIYLGFFAMVVFVVVNLFSNIKY